MNTHDGQFSQIEVKSHGNIRMPEFVVYIVIFLAEEG